MADLNKTLDDMAARIAKLEKSVKQRSGDDGGGQWLSMGSYAALLPVTLTTDRPYILAIPKRCTLRRFLLGAHVVTTNSGSNYWTIQLISNSGLATSVNTSAMTHDLWTNLSTDTFAISEFDTSNVYWLITFTKTGTPGSLYLATPCLYII